MSRKVRCRTIAVLLIGCCAAGASAAAETSEPVRLRLFTYFPTNDQVAHLYRELAFDLRNDSGGALSLQVFTAGELPYTPFDMIKIVAAHQVDLVDGSVGLLAGDVPELNVFGMPFLCVSFDEFNEAVGGTRTIFADHLNEKADVRVLFHWTMPPQNLWTDAPIERLEDLKGKKIRVWNQQQVEMLKIVGAVPVSIASAEVSIALQRKVIDGVITSALSVRDWKLYDFIEHGYMLNLSMGHQFVLMSQKSWSELPASLQTILQSNARDWSATFRRQIPAMDLDARRELRDQGMTLREPTPFDLAKARQSAAPMWLEWAAEDPVSEELLKAVRKALRK